MNILLFHGSIESINHFLDELGIALQRMGHEINTVNLGNHDKISFRTLLEQMDVVICYDCIGMVLDSVKGDSGQNIYDERDIMLVNILVDHPMTLREYLLKAPKKSVHFCVDEYHVEYVKRFLGINNVYFMPHVASVNIANMSEDKEKDIDILLPGGIRSCNEVYAALLQHLRGERMQRLALEVIEFLIVYPLYTLETALEYVLNEKKIILGDEHVAVFLEQLKNVDTFLRFYFREKVVTAIADAGIPITLVGGGWNALPLCKRWNVTALPGCKFAEVFPYMERAKITLTVMPWFKAGSHERIFNALLHNSCPLTDPSTWLTKHLLPNVE